MNPFITKEISEVSSKNLENSSITKAFENTKNFEQSKPEKIALNTRNKDLDGDCHSETGTPFVKKTIMFEGNRYEGVFPKFDAIFETRLPRDIYQSSDAVQFKHCVNQLRKKIESDPQFSKQFSNRQLEQIKDGSPNISGLTWHHTENPGKMQLVNSDIHAKCGHTGGRSIWGGGSDAR